MICQGNRSQLRNLLFEYPIILTVPLSMIVSLVIASDYAGARQSDPNYDTLTSRPSIDEKQFITYPPYSIGSSPPLLRNLAENEEIVYTLIENFYTKFGPRPVDNIKNSNAPTFQPFKLMHSYLTNFEITSGSLQLNSKRQTTEDPNSINRAFKTAWNPLATYFMIRRVLDMLKAIIRNLDLTKKAELTLRNQIFHVMKSGGWPVEDDLKSALSAILRIQHVYDLSTFEIASGNLAGFQTNLNLSAEDCVDIGDEALMDEGGASPYYALAVEWFEEARRRKLHEGISSVISLAEIDEYLSYAIEVHDEEWSAGGGGVRDTSFFTTRCKYSKSLSARTRRVTAELAALKSGKVPNSKLNEIKYWGTCSGQNYQSDSDRAKLFCWYETEVSPYHKINPLKAELLSIEPHPIIQYYDFIGNEMISRIKFKTGHQLAHSSVFDDNARPTKSPSFRTSSSSFIDDSNLNEFHSIPDNVDAAMGLSMDGSISSEMLHIAAYTTGGHYSIHLDGWPRMAEKMLVKDKKIFSDTNRIATFMFYLEDVEKGGGTSFPLSGISVQPIKGSAVLWFNLMRNGEPDGSTYHGGCPVIIGEKWIATKWILSEDQMFQESYKCVPDQKARFVPKINGKNLMDLI